MALLDYLLIAIVNIGLLNVQQTYSVNCPQYQNYDDCEAVSGCTYLGLQCVCASLINMDILFTISTSSYIGKDNFDNLIKPWLTQLTNGGMNDGIAHVGWSVFSSNSRFENISKTSYEAMGNYISGIYYDGGIANLPISLQDALNAFKSSPYTSQKINIIIMGSNPYTQSSLTTEVCQYASSLKQLGVEVIFVGIGKSWRRGRIECLVGNAATDVIYIPEYSEKDLNDSLPQLYDVMCQTETKIKITEVKPVTTTSAARFIEFFNMGTSIEQDDTLNFDGLVTASVTGYTIPQGKYVVLYDADDGTVTCSTCSSSQCTVNSTTDLCREAIYIPCTSCFDDDMTMTEWSVDIMDDSSNMLDSLTYGDTIEYWAVLPDDYSYSLEYLGYNNQYGANYVRSCAQEGSPGAPTRSCTSSELQCQVDEDCQASGDGAATCPSNTCDCFNRGFYPKRGNCYPIPGPSNCTAYKVKNESQEYWNFTFLGAPFDTDTQFTISYYTEENQMTTTMDRQRIKREDDVYWDGTRSEAGFVYTSLSDGTYNSPAWSANCTVETQSPTTSPTASPTDSPTRSPTLSPTPSPTWQTPGVYLFGDFCDRDRCSCNGLGFGCCIEPNETNANCTDNKQSFTAGLNQLTYNSLKVSPEAYPYPIRIDWRISFNGTVRVSTGTGRRRMIDESNGTISNLLGISVEPMNGSAWINDTREILIGLNMSEAKIVCPHNNSDCKKELIGLSAVFIFEAYECITWNDIGGNESDDCEIIYPSLLNMFIDRSDTGGSGSGGGGEDKIPTWLWIVLIACGIFLALLSWLLYRYWYKGRKQSVEYHKITDDIEFQKNYNDEDIATRLENPDTQFNPLATGMPGKDREHDPLTVERQQREQQQQNDMVEPNAVKNVFKEEMGQVHGKQMDGAQNMNAPLLG